MATTQTLADDSPATSSESTEPNLPSSPIIQSNILTPGIICYDVKFDNMPQSMRGCQSRAWEGDLLQQLHDGLFVIPLDKTKMDNLHRNAKRDDGLLRRDVGMELLEIISNLAIRGTERRTGATLKDLMDLYVVGNALMHIVEDGNFGKLTYWVRFCANAKPDFDCARSPTWRTTDSWERSGARIELQSAVSP